MKYTILSIVLLIVIGVAIIANYYMSVYPPLEQAKGYLQLAMSVNNVTIAKAYIEKALKKLEPYSGWIGMWYDPKHDFDYLKIVLANEIEACERFENVSPTTYDYQKFISELKKELSNVVKSINEIEDLLNWYPPWCPHFPIHIIFVVLYILAFIFITIYVNCLESE